MSWISCVFTIGDCFVPAVIVSVTGMCVSWKSPESWTVTAIERSVDAVIVFRLLDDESSFPPGLRLHRDDVRAVQAADRAAGRGAADALQHERHRVRRDERVRDRARLRRDHAADAVVRELLQRQRAEVVVPDHVAREQAVGLLGEQVRVGGVVLRARGALERVRERRDPGRAELERLDQVAGSRRGAGPAGSGPRPPGRSAARCRRCPASLLTMSCTFSAVSAVAICLPFAVD